jgi:threonine dehydratase
VPETIADGLRSTLGISNFSIITEQVNDIVLASEQAIVDAMRLVWMRMKIVIEPSAAVAVAAVMENREMFSGKRVATILSGGNVDLDALPW